MARDRNGRKASYKINRYETTTQQHPTFWRPFASVHVSAYLSFPRTFPSPFLAFLVDFSISLSFSLSHLDFFIHIIADSLYLTRATFAWLHKEMFRSHSTIRIHFYFYSVWNFIHSKWQERNLCITLLYA